jgi:hypothetical protein
MNAYKTKEIAIEAQVKYNKDVIDTTLRCIKNTILRASTGGEMMVDYSTCELNPVIISSIIQELEKDDYNVSHVQGGCDELDYLRISW